MSIFFMIGVNKAVWSMTQTVRSAKKRKSRRINMSKEKVLKLANDIANIPPGIPLNQRLKLRNLILDVAEIAIYEFKKDPSILTSIKDWENGS